MMSSTTDKISETAKELRPAPGNFKRVADFLVDTASKTATEIAHLGKGALKTGMAKDAAAGAAIGAVVAVPIPLVGPIAGAVVGAGLGVYKNIVHGSKTMNDETPPLLTPPKVIDVESKVVPSIDKFEEISKLHDLKVKGALTEEEFSAEKKKVLDR